MQQPFPWVSARGRKGMFFFIFLFHFILFLFFALGILDWQQRKITGEKKRYGCDIHCRNEKEEEEGEYEWNTARAVNEIWECVSNCTISEDAIVFERASARAVIAKEGELPIHIFAARKSRHTKRCNGSDNEMPYKGDRGREKQIEIDK